MGSDSNEVLVWLKNARLWDNKKRLENDPILLHYSKSSIKTKNELANL
jgi:hypothetical protein